MKRFLSLLCAVMFVFAFAGIAYAEAPETPTTIKGVTVVNDEWVKANYQKMAVYDVRKKAEYVEGHIPGAISAPYSEKSEKTPDFDASVDKLDLSKFPADKNTPVIVYCNGPKCWKSFKSSVGLAKAGYKNVYQYRDNGFPGWKAKGYPVE